MPNMTDIPQSAPLSPDDFDSPASRGFVRYEISLLRSELKQEIAALRTELKQEIAALRLEMASMEHRIVVRLSVVVTFVVVVAQLGSALLWGA